MEQRKAFDERLSQRKIFYDAELMESAISAIEANYSEMPKGVWLGKGAPQEENSGCLQLYADEPNAESLIAALVKNSHITYLGLCRYDLDDKAMSQLKEVLAKNSTLKKLVFYQTTISSVGIKHLAEALKNSPHLTEITFIDMNLDDEGAEVIGEALKENQGLRSISFSQPSIYLERCIQKKGESALIEGLEQNYRIVYFTVENSTNLWNSRVSEEKKALVEKRNAILDRNQCCRRSIIELVETFKFINNFFKLKGVLEKDTIVNSFVGKLKEAKQHVEILKQRGHPAATNYEALVNHVEKKFDFLFKKQNLFQLFDVYTQYFHRGSDEAVDYTLAEALFVESDTVLLEALGFTERLRYQWILKLLKNNTSPEAEQFRISAYKNLAGMFDAVGANTTFKEAVGADKILTVAQLEKVKETLNSSEHEIFAALKAGKFIEDLYTIQFNTKEEEFAAQILNDLNRGQKIAIYEQLMLKGEGEEVKFLSRPVQYDEFEEWIDTVKGNEEIWKAQFLSEWTTNSRPKYKVLDDIADMLASSVYQSIFGTNFSLSPQAIDATHSRVLSAYRLESLAFFSCEQIKRILQIEYDALPNQDKEGATHYSFWRYRTLERGLEEVFKKNNLRPLTSEQLSESEKLASFLLRWIGEQERSLSYKMFKDQKLINMMEAIGDIAHDAIVSNQNDVEEVKHEMIEKLNNIENGINISGLINEINQKFTYLPQNTIK